MSRLTIKDIARICHVGTSTVSRAINDDPTVNWKTKQMILEAVQKYGALKGGLLALWRILRCNPFSKGGYDPVP